MKRHSQLSTKQQKSLEGQVFLIMTGFSCNNNCIMCTTTPKSKNYPDRSTKDIVNDIDKGSQQGYDRVEFTGGEPTIRKDILYLIDYAKSVGYADIGLSTNGRMLSYDNFCKKAFNDGLNRVNISLYGYNNETHDAITRMPGSFMQTTQGVKNILRYPEMIVTINTVIFKLNYTYLNELGRFINSLGVKYWNPLDLIPDGYAKKNYKHLAVDSLTQLSDNFSNLIETMRLFDAVTFFDFSLCLFSSEIRNLPNTHFISAQGRIETANQVGYHPKRFNITGKSKIYTDIHKKRLGICKKCKFYNACGGVWKDYLNAYGGDEIKTLMKKNSCIAQNLGT